jgi:glycosyltransferase involved in cell wall biosynthesis
MTLKIGYLIPEFPSQTHIFFWREVEALVGMNVTPQLVSTRSPRRALISHSWAAEARSQTEYLFPPKVRTALGAVWALFRAGPAGWWRGLMTLAGSEGSAYARLRMMPFLLAGAELAWLARRRGWAHVHVHSCGNSANIALFAHRLSGLSYSLTLHGPLTDYGPNQKQKWAHSAFALVITRRLRKEVEDELGGFLPPVIELAPMGVGLNRFPAPRAPQPWSGSGPCRLFACGRLNPSKGHDDLIRAVAELRHQGIDAHLHIAGEDDTGGGYRQLLETLRSELGLTENVKLLGAVSEETVRAELEAAHVFALASLEEPLGVAIMEAMAMKVPVVVTGAGGVAELVDDGVDGLLTAPRDVHQMSEALLKVLRDPHLALQLSEAGRRKIETSFHSGVSAEVLRRCILNSTGPWSRGVEPRLERSQNDDFPAGQRR